MDEVLIVSHDVAGRTMAGPGIRYWEMARALVQRFAVILAVPKGSDLIDGEEFSVWRYDRSQWDTLAEAVEGARTAVVCGDTLFEFPQLDQVNIPLVVDGYDPHTLETIELFAYDPEIQRQNHRIREQVLARQCLRGDFFICASERQRDWWLGLLEAHGRVNPYTFNEDRSLRRLVDVVPFGLRASPPRHTRQVLKGVWSGIAPDDRVVLWGGGLWQWLDPLTAIRALARIQTQRTDIKLVFPGTRHPNPDMVDMPMRVQAERLARDLGLLDTAVFFGEWVPYADWPNVLLEADVSLSLHFNSIETRLAFRSRVLDYIWAKLPMVGTQGDIAADLIKQYKLGRVVDYEDDAAVAAAILDLLDTSNLREKLRPNFERLAREMTWEKVTEPLAAFCAEPRLAPDRAMMREQGMPLSAPDLWQSLSKKDAEIAALRNLAEGYERGRFIRMMKKVNALKRAIFG